MPYKKSAPDYLTFGYTGITMEHSLLNKDPLRRYSLLLFTVYHPKENLKWTEYFWIEASARAMVGCKVGFNIAEFADFILGWFGIDIAGDDVSGAEVARRLSALTGKKLGYFEIPLEGMREQNEDFALMFEWFDKVGYNVDVAKLKRDYPEVHWTSFDDWLDRQDWSVIDAPAG